MKKQSQIIDLIIRCTDNSQDAALRIFDKEMVVYYSSTRIGGVIKTDGGYLVKDVNEFIGKNYELKLLATKKVLTGVVNNPDNLNSKSKKTED